jgi:hypothetical protein
MLFSHASIVFIGAFFAVENSKGIIFICQLFSKSHSSSYSSACQQKTAQQLFGLFHLPGKQYAVLFCTKYEDAAEISLRPIRASGLRLTVQ